MFGEQFYPTPGSVIKKMFEPYMDVFTARNGNKRTVYKLGDKRILEPSAGKGDIVDFIENETRAKSVYSIELDPNLQSILKGKGHRVIGSDFMSYENDYILNMVVMNPPFANGVDHVLKAWDTLSLGGDIIALLNAETILNPYTEKRKILKGYIENHGSYELLGDCFSDSEIKTDVEVVLVRLKRPEQDSPFNFKFDPIGDDEIKFDKDTISNEIALNDSLGTMIRNYDKSKEAYIEYIKAKKRLEYYSEPIVPSNSSVIGMVNESNAYSLEESYNKFIDGFKSMAWRKIMNLMGVEKLMTSKVKDNFEKFSESQGSMAINKENINSLVMMLLQNGDQIMDQAVVDVFDLFTKYHDENRVHVEGWKTNEAWKVGKKIILPNYIRYDYGKFDASYNRWSEFSDIEKVMCYLTGKKIKEVKSLEMAIKQYPVGYTKKMDSEFFEFRCYKKGTIHLFFKDEWLWAEFNQRAAKGKKWVGK